MKKIILLFLIAGLLPLATYASSPTGFLIKSAHSSAVYFAYNDKRFVFPNEQIYKSWYPNFDNVIEVADQDIADLPLGGNVTYRPGSLIKIESDPRVFVISHTGLIHWLTTETVARENYGDDWSTRIFDIPVTSFLDYDEDEPIQEGEEINSDVTTAIQQLAQNMKERPFPVLTLLDNSTTTRRAIIRMDAATVPNRGWSSIIEGETRDGEMIAVCEYTWCELTLEYSTSVSYIALTTVKNSSDLLQSNTIRLTFPD